MTDNTYMILQRDVLNKKLTEALTRPLTIVTAPMGYGKTTAVKTFFKITNCRVVWTTMTAAVRIARGEYFWLLLVKEISNHYPDFAEDLEARGFPGDSAQLFRLIQKLQNLERRSDTPIIMVIDDYHLIENQQINELIERVVLANIPWLRVILISRSIPRLPIDEMAAKNICASITFTDLTFSYQDALDYFQLIHFAGDEAVMKKIFYDSNGWIASMYLMAKSYFDGHPLEDIKKMLKVSLFDKYDPDMQATLVKLSLFNIISPKQAVYIFDDYNIVNQLEQLHRDNAFVTRDGKGNYKFHQIFLNFLHDQQPKYDLDEKALYRRAGKWFSMNNDHMMAFHYWLLSQDYDLILSALEIADISHVNSLDRKLIFPIFNEIGQDKMYEYPLASLKYVFLLILYDQEDRAVKILEDFEAYFRENTHPKYSQNQILAEIEIMRTTLGFNDMAQVIRYARRAYDLLDGKISLLRKRNSVYTYGCPHFSYMYYKEAGTYADLIQLIRDGFLYHIKATDGCGAGAVELAIAEHQFETGKLDEVEMHAARAQHYATRNEQTCIVAGSLFLQARLYKYLGREEELEQVLSRLEEMRQIEQNPLNSNVFDNALGYLYTILGDVDKVPAWILEENSSDSVSTYQGTAFNDVIYQMSLIRRQQYGTFEKNRIPFLLQFDQFHNQIGIILYYINLSIARLHLSGIEAAAFEMQRAIQIARQDHLLLVFAENAEEVLPILKSGLILTEQGFLDELIAACEHGMSASVKHSSGSVLSLREVEILDLLEQGANSKDIAAALYISQNTVKRHLQNIYQKLDVHNKTLAIKAYRNLQKQRDSKS